MDDIRPPTDGPPAIELDDGARPPPVLSPKAQAWLDANRAALQELNEYDRIHGSPLDYLLPDILDAFDE